MASIVITEGTQAGAHFPITLPLVSVGRDEECTIQVLDQKVSRKHLQIRHDPAENKHFAGDYRSANGVFVNGKQVVADVALADGDHIRIGSTILVYLSGDHADDASALAAAKKKGEWARATLMGG